MRAEKFTKTFWYGQTHRQQMKTNVCHCGNSSELTSSQTMTTWTIIHGLLLGQKRHKKQSAPSWSTSFRFPCNSIKKFLEEQYSGDKGQKIWSTNLLPPPSHTHTYEMHINNVTVTLAITILSYFSPCVKKRRSLIYHALMASLTETLFYKYFLHTGADSS